MSRSIGAEAASRVVAAMISKGFFDGLADTPTMINNANGKLLEISDMLAIWIKSGTAKAPDPLASQDPLASGQVCPQCQLLRVDCTCPTEQFIR